MWVSPPAPAVAKIRKSRLIFKSFLFLLDFQRHIYNSVAFVARELG
jgi:hypothetical protein